MYMDCTVKLGRHARTFGDIGYGAAGKAGTTPGSIKI